MGNSKIASPSLEAIDFQKDDFFKALIKLIDDFKEDYKKPGEKSAVAKKYSDELTKVICKYTDSEALIGLITADPSCAWVGPFSITGDYDNNTVLISLQNREKLRSKVSKYFLEKKDLLEGGVDLRTGKIYGDFKKFPSIVVMPINSLIDPTLSSEENAAVTLHEVGHILVFFQFIGKTVTTNQVLAYVARTYGDKTYTDREKIITEAKTLLNLKSLDEKELAKLSDPDKVNVVILNEQVQHTRSELGSDIYDAVTWEQLADNYAARQGAGLPMLTYISKFKNRKAQQRTIAQYWMFEGLKIALGVVAVGTVFTPTGLVGMALSAVAGFLMYSKISTDKVDPTYDPPKDRLVRIRNQLVQAIKDQSIPKPQVKQITEDIHLADEILKNMSGRDQLWDILKEYVNPYSRKNRQQKQLQKELEGFAHNDLFVLAAKMKHNL